MKNFRFFGLASCLLVLVFMGCEKESLESEAESTAPVELKMDVIDAHGEITSHTVTPTPSAGVKTRGAPIQFASGDFDYSYFGDMKFKFTAVKNPAGVHGEWEIDSDWFGHIYLESLCVYVNGHSAIIAGVVTAVERPPSPGYYGEEGTVFWVKVYDNGEGTNSVAPDQTGFIIASLSKLVWQQFYPSAEAVVAGRSCESWANFYWGPPFLDVNGQIQVK